MEKADGEEQALAHIPDPMVESISHIADDLIGANASASKGKLELYTPDYWRRWQKSQKSRDPTKMNAIRCSVDHTLPEEEEGGISVQSSKSIKGVKSPVLQRSATAGFTPSRRENKSKRLNSKSSPNRFDGLATSPAKLDNGQREEERGAGSGSDKAAGGSVGESRRLWASKLRTEELREKNRRAEEDLQRARTGRPGLGPPPPRRGETWDNVDGHDPARAQALAEEDALGIVRGETADGRAARRDRGPDPGVSFGAGRRGDPWNSTGDHGFFADDGSAARRLHRSTPAFSIAGRPAAGRPDCPLGPGAYRPRSGATRAAAAAAPLARAPRFPAPLAEAVGPAGPGPEQYQIKSIFSEQPKNGTSFGHHSFYDYQKIKKKLKAISPTGSASKLVEMKTFGYGCNLEEHCKYGACLDGKCMERGLWERSNKLRLANHRQQEAAAARETAAREAAAGEARRRRRRRPRPGGGKGEERGRPSPGGGTPGGASAVLGGGGRAGSPSGSPEHFRSVASSAGHHHQQSATTLEPFSLSQSSVNVSLGRSSVQTSLSHHHEKSTPGASRPATSCAPSSMAGTGTISERRAPSTAAGAGGAGGPRPRDDGRPGSALLPRSALHFAVAYEDLELADRLLREGHDPDRRDEAGRGALHVAAAHGFARLARRLLDNAAHPLVNTKTGYAARRHRPDLDLRDVEGNAPLHLAAAEGHLSVVEMLLVAGADQGVVNGRGATPLEVAGGHAVFQALRQHADAVSLRERLAAARAAERRLRQRRQAREVTRLRNEAEGIELKMELKKQELLGLTTRLEEMFR